MSFKKFWKKLENSVNKQWHNPAHMYKKFFTESKTAIQHLGQGLGTMAHGDFAGAFDKASGGESTMEKAQRHESEQKAKEMRMLNANKEVVNKVSQGNKQTQLQVDNMMSAFSQGQGMDSEQGTSAQGVKNYLGESSSDSLAIRLLKKKKAQEGLGRV